jgi:hypothetical protein
MVYDCGRFRTQPSPQARGAYGLGVKGQGDLHVDERAIGAKRREHIRGFLSLHAF